jgi:hypothetical protein
MFMPTTLLVHRYLSTILGLLDFLVSPKTNPSSKETQTGNPTLEELVVSTAASLLGPSAFSTSPNLSTDQRGVPVFDILTSVRPSCLVHVACAHPSSFSDSTSLLIMLSGGVDLQGPSHPCYRPVTIRPSHSADSFVSSMAPSSTFCLHTTMPLQIPS